MPNDLFRANFPLLSRGKMLSAWPWQQLRLHHVVLASSSVLLSSCLYAQEKMASHTQKLSSQVQTVAKPSLCLAGADIAGLVVLCGAVQSLQQQQQTAFLVKHHGHALLLVYQADCTPQKVRVQAIRKGLYGHHPAIHRAGLASFEFSCRESFGSMSILSAGH